MKVLNFNTINGVFRFLLVIACLLSSQLLLAGNLNSENEIVKEQCEIKKQFSGKYIDYINVAFSDYVKSKGYLDNNHDNINSIHGNIRYYIFIVNEDYDSIVVEIQYNQTLLRKEKNVVVKGGDAKYFIRKGSKIIEKKEFYK